MNITDRWKISLGSKGFFGFQKTKREWENIKRLKKLAKEIEIEMTSLPLVQRVRAARKPASVNLELQRAIHRLKVATTQFDLDTNRMRVRVATDQHDQSEQAEEADRFHAAMSRIRIQVNKRKPKFTGESESVDWFWVGSGTRF